MDHRASLVCVWSHQGQHRKHEGGSNTWELQLHPDPVVCCVMLFCVAVREFNAKTAEYKDVPLRVLIKVCSCGACQHCCCAAALRDSLHPAFPVCHCACSPALCTLCASPSITHQLK